MQSRFIKASAAISAVAATSAALAGGGDTYDVGFSDAAYFNAASGGIDPASPNYNGQGAAAEAGRYISSFGWSNTVLEVCWNVGSGYSCWASECTFAMSMTDGAEAGFYVVGAPDRRPDWFRHRRRMRRLPARRLSRGWPDGLRAFHLPGR